MAGKFENGGVGGQHDQQFVRGKCIRHDMLETESWPGGSQVVLVIPVNWKVIKSGIRVLTEGMEEKGSYPRGRGQCLTPCRRWQMSVEREKDYLSEQLTVLGISKRREPET